MSELSSRIMIHKDGEEGGIHISRATGAVLTPADERPAWADGLASAMLKERQEYYEARLGPNLPESLLNPDTIAFQDLEWIGVDAEADEVHLEADGDFRMDLLAQHLGVDRDDVNDEKNFKTAIATGEAEHTYKTQPGTDEATLRQVEDQGFGEEKQAASV